MFRTFAKASSSIFDLSCHFFAEAKIFKLERLRKQKKKIPNNEKVMPKYLNNLQINVFQVPHYYHRKEHKNSEILLVERQSLMTK